MITDDNMIKHDDNMNIQLCQLGENINNSKKKKKECTVIQLGLFRCMLLNMLKAKVLVNKKETSIITMGTD